ncbi:MAG: Holliday junction branch migration protein RuvA [Candidatus Roizmanbacteria bacterium]
MLGKIHGIIEEVHGNRAYISTASGVSYLVFVTPAVASQIGTEVSVYTYFAVREDAQVLYGLSSYQEFVFFEKLISVDGVGPKMAFVILSTSTVVDIIEAVSSGSVKFFQDIKGVGKKTAQKIMIELSNFVGKDFDLDMSEISAEDSTVIEALQALGFTKADMQPILKLIPPDLSLEQKIKEGIRLMTSNL